MIPRPTYFQTIQDALKTHPIVAVLGPRQCGKTTLARTYAKEKHALKRTHVFDLEDLEDLARLEIPKLALEPLKGLIVIDEIQRRPVK